MKINVPKLAVPVFTHEGAPAVKINPEQQLRRTVGACLLWENNFYEDGENIADRIKRLVPLCRPEFVAACAAEARTSLKLRHVPLLLVREMARHKTHAGLVATLLPHVIQRADELTEFVAIYWKDGKQPLSNQVKKGLATAFGKFNEYNLAKYNRDGAVKLRDVLFLCHAKAKDPEQDALWKRLINGELKTPDTWEVALSGGADKAETFRRLMAEDQLGILAYLKNMRNMTEAGITAAELVQYAAKVDISRALPYRFISAARAVPQMEHVLEPMMLRAVEGLPKFSGRTAVLIDVSGSMDSQISSKSDLNRIDAANGLAILLRELCDDVDTYTFSDKIVQVPPRRGFALRDAVVASQPHRSTHLAEAVTTLNTLKYDRLVVFTDEQAATRVPQPAAKLAYLINVASNEHGVGHGAWQTVTGWSESILSYIQELEKA